jgi:hypothetical protein
MRRERRFIDSFPVIDNQGNVYSVNRFRWYTIFHTGAGRGETEGNFDFETEDGRTAQEKSDGTFEIFDQDRTIIAQRV